MLLNDKIVKDRSRLVNIILENYSISLKSPSSKSRGFIVFLSVNPGVHSKRGYHTSFGSSSSPYCMQKSMCEITVSSDSVDVRSKGRKDTSG